MQGRPTALHACQGSAASIGDDAMKASRVDPLKEILEIERGIRDRLVVEKAKAARWLEQCKLDLEPTTQSEIDRLKTAAAQNEASARRDATEKAEEIPRQARVLAEHIEQLDEALMKRLVAQHIAVILPGWKRDR
jgi:hypothetical protein